MARQPQHRQVTGGQAAREAETDRVLTENYAADAMELEAMQLNSANAYKPIMGALDPSEVEQGLQFWQNQLGRPITPRGRAAAEEMIQLYQGRAQELQAGATNTVKNNYPISPVADPFDPQVADDILVGPFRSEAPRRPR